MGKKKRKISITPYRSRPAKIRRKDVSRKMAEAKNYDQRNIKCTLEPFCKYKTVKREIEECVLWMSRLQIHAHHVMGMWLTRHEGRIPVDYGEYKGKARDLYGFYNKIMRNLANHLQGRTERKGVDKEIRDLCEEYCNFVGLEADWGDSISGWKLNVLNEMARQSATEHKTHLETNLYIYAVRYLRFLIRRTPTLNDIRELSKKEFNKVFSAVCDAFIERERVLHVVKRRPSTLEIFPTKHKIWRKAQTLVSQMMKLVPKETSLSEKSEIMFRILKELEPFAADLQQKFLSGEITKTDFGKSKWTFNLCPQLGWRPKHIQISTTGLRELLKDLSKNYSHFRTILDGLGDGTLTYEKKYDLWNQIFNLKRVLRTRYHDNSTDRRFHCFMSTDGVSVALTVDHRKSNRKDNNDQTLIHKHVQDLAGLKKGRYGIYHSRVRIVGLDPGKKSPATWVVHNPYHQRKHQKWKGRRGEKTRKEDRYETGILKGGEWRFLSGQKQYTRKMNKRMTSSCSEWRNLPSTKTVDSDKLLSAYKQQVAMWDQLKEAFFDNKWFQKQKMRKFCRHQRAMEEVVTRICGTKKKEEQKKVIVAYGDGDKNGNLRGTAPMMSTKLFKKVSQSCCVVVVNEFKTSQLCSCCHSQMTKFQKQFRMKRCINSDCIRTVWDRDVNAAINILNLFLELCHSAKDDGKGQRLEAFTRKN